MNNLRDTDSFVFNSRRLLDKEEMTKLRTALQSDEGILKHHYSVDDGTGRKVSECLFIFLSFNHSHIWEQWENTTYC